MSTLFEKMMAREIPAEILHEDRQCVVLPDIHPQAPLHLLIVPRQSILNISAATENDQLLLGHLLLVAKKMANAFHCDGDFRLVINNGENAGQTVPHLHIHLLSGRAFHWPPG